MPVAFRPTFQFSPPSGVPCLTLSPCLCYLLSPSHFLTPFKEVITRVTSPCSDKLQGLMMRMQDRVPILQGFTFKGTAHQRDLPGSPEILLSWAGPLLLSPPCSNFHLGTTAEGGFIASSRQLPCSAPSGESESHTRCPIFILLIR